MAVLSLRHFALAVWSSVALLLALQGQSVALMSAQSYSSYVRPSSHVVDMRRAIFGGALTPLHEVVAPAIAQLPGDIGAQLKREFWERHDASADWDGKHAAQSWLANEVSEYEREKIHRAFDESEIRDLAKRWSELCARMQRLEVMQDFARSVGVPPPAVGKRTSRVGAARRLACPRWWRRQIRKHYTRRAESHLRAAGFVHKRRQLYASDRAVAHRRERKFADRALLQELVAVSDAGDQLELWDVAEKSQANPVLRRAELMTRMRGFEECAEAAGHGALFITLTCPSAFHRMHANGTRNDRWEGFAPREGQQWLCRMWARARAKLKRMCVSFYGFRIAEPHHDGTPHWHLLCFAASAGLAALREVLRVVWLSEYADEPGAREYRSKFVPIVREKGSAAGYVAKYVAKNVDGFEVGEDFEAVEGHDAKDTSARVAAWASAHGIRQFQQIGGPSVCVWRELRRLRDRVDLVPSIEAARKAADAGEWAQFIAAVGGVAVGRRSSVGIWLERTGELNQYDELKAAQVAGVEARRYGFERASTVFKALPFRRYEDKDKGRVFVRRRMTHRRRTHLRVTMDVLARVRTRCKVWRIERKASGKGSGGQLTRAACSSGSSPVPSLGPVSITVRDSKGVPSRSVDDGHASRSPRGSPWMH